MIKKRKKMTEMKLISWNVNGIRSAWNHGLSSLLEPRDADIIAFQETRLDKPDPIIDTDGYYTYWSFCKSRRGYSGTMVLSKWKPLHYRTDIGDNLFDPEGRFLCLEYETFYFVNCYVPKSQGSELRSDYREMWDACFLGYLMDLQRSKPVIVCGDFNVPLTDNDIYEKSLWVKRYSEGFQTRERENLLKLTRNGYVDTYRLLHPEETGKYTWWSNRLNMRDKNRGWRLDYFFVSEELRPLVRESTMMSEKKGSDHCPLILEIDLKAPGPAAGRSDNRTTYTYADLIAMEEQHISYSSIKKRDLTGLWKSIDWGAAERHLQYMQRDLAYEAYNHDWDEITRLQKRIVYSLDARLLAVRYVCQTGSGPGVDCIRWNTPHEKMLAALSLASWGYQAMPANMLEIKCKNGKVRNIHMETYYDRAMQVLYAFSLDPVAESWGDSTSFAYRKGRSPYDLYRCVKNTFSGEDAPEWAVRADVHRCYESITHEWILRHIPLAPKVLRQFLDAGYIFKGEFFPMTVGIGIGCSLSPIIANMALDGLQEYIYDRLYPNGGEIDDKNGKLIRYADDIIVAARDEETAGRIITYVRQFLLERGMHISTEKAGIFRVRDEFTFMSRTYFKRGANLFARPSDDAIARFKASLQETIRNYTGSQKTLINKLNKKITGWVTYHKVSEADNAFREMDTFIAAELLTLNQKMHPKWDIDKIKEKYWYVDAKGCPRFVLPDKKEVRVNLLADTVIIDEPLNDNPGSRGLKEDFNPYIDINYMEQRKNDRQIQDVTGKYRSIWNRQDGKCYYCGRDIVRDEARSVTEIDNCGRSFVASHAYVHTRCLDNSITFLDTDIAPFSIDDTMTLLERAASGRKTLNERLTALSEFFRVCDKNSVTLTFREIEEIMGEPLDAAAKDEEFWYRAGFQEISQCWLENGYEIYRLHLEDRPRVVFHLTDDSRKKSVVDIPAVLKYQRIPLDAKYELENFCQYLVKKYGL